MLKMKMIPRFEFDKNDFGFGILFQRENESKKYIREHKCINYIFGFVFLWFTVWLEVKLIGGNKDEKNND